MGTRLRNFTQRQRAPWWLLGTVLLTVTLALVTRPRGDRLWGDEGTFVAMAESLVRDGDLRFDAADAEWARSRQPGPAVTVILQQTPQGITYSKPLLYPLLGAPFLALFGERGLEIFNLLALILGLTAGWRHLRGIGPPAVAGWTLAAFCLASTLPVYIGWKMSDLLLAVLTLTGLSSALSGLRAVPGQREGSHVASVALGGFLLGAGTTMRFPAAAILAAAVVGLALHRSWRRAAAVTLGAAVALVGVSLATQKLQGTMNPYKTVRSSFNESTGYPAGLEAADSTARFSNRPATQSATWRPPLQPRRSAYSALYFVVGRHTGLLLYFPIALVFVYQLLRRPTRVGLTLLAGVAVISAFYLLWMPENYFGGSTFVGNRYFLGAFPALLIGLTTLPSRRFLIAAGLVALATWGSALWSAQDMHRFEISSQNHTRAGIFRRFPYESTAQRIDGTIDRFWAGDFLRFLDPFSQAAKWSFKLSSQHPPSDLLLATEWEGDRLQFVVVTDNPQAYLEACDYRNCQSVPIGAKSSAPPGLVEIKPSPAWRRHSFWWKPGKLYAARTLRLSIRATDGTPTEAVVRYLGRGRELAPLAASLHSPVLPTTAIAGSEWRTMAEIRNEGRLPWRTETTLPIRLAYRLLDSNSGELIERRWIELPEQTRPGEMLTVPLAVVWPERAGSVDLLIELLREPAARLGELGRLEIARQTIVVSRDNPVP